MARENDANRRAPSIREKTMRRGPEHFGEQDLSLLYVAQKLKHALRLEQLLTDAGIDYLVESDEYAVGLLFRRVRVGAFFYVAPDNADAARDVARRGGFTPADVACDPDGARGL